MGEQKLSKDLLERIPAVTSLRPKRVIEHILKRGFVTTEELRTQYGYDHPPRAARDVRESGIPLETFRVEREADGRSIGAYRFADLSAIRRGLIGGRQAFSKSFKTVLIKASQSRCNVCLQEYQERYLQIDHRVPYEVAGDIEFQERDTTPYMLVCASCNRAKSWSCEHCSNWIEKKSTKVCGTSYWASPESYTHIAQVEARRLDLTWTGRETEVFDSLQSRAHTAKEPMPEYVKRVLRDTLTRK
jgi:hypothetical protein